MVTYFVDSDMDMTPELCEKYGYKMISMPYSIGEKTIYPYKDFDVFDAHGFYQALRDGAEIPSTAAISKEQYISYFEPEFAAGNDVFYAHFSAAMTNTFDFMKQALDELLPKYPERKFYEVDTKAITTLCTLFAIELAEERDKGKTPEELVEWGKDLADHLAMYFVVDDLKFFRRSGRVTGLSATMGTLLGIRPLIYMNEEGKMVSCGTAKGRAKALAQLLQFTKELGDHLKDHLVLIGNTDAPELVEEVIRMLKEEYGEGLNYMVLPANPTAGSHCGPDGVSISFHAIHR